MINPFKALLHPFKRLIGRHSNHNNTPDQPSHDQPHTEEKPFIEIAHGVVIYHSLRIVHLLFSGPAHGASFSQTILIPSDEAIRPAQDYSDFAAKIALQSNPPLSLLSPLDAIKKGYRPLQPLEPHLSL